MYQKAIKLTGVTYRGAQRNIRTFGNKDIGVFDLVREPHNQVDSNAIKVTVSGIVFLGYIPAEVAEDLAPLMDSGRCFIAHFVSRNKHPLYGTLGLTVRIEEVPCREAA